MDLIPILTLIIGFLLGELAPFIGLIRNRIEAKNRIISHLMRVLKRLAAIRLESAYFLSQGETQDNLEKLFDDMHADSNREYTTTRAKYEQWIDSIASTDPQSAYELADKDNPFFAINDLLSRFENEKWTVKAIVIQQVIEQIEKRMESIILLIEKLIIKKLWGKRKLLDFIQEIQNPPSDEIKL